MTIERLKEYRNLVFSISRMEEQLAELDTRLTKTTKPLSDMPRNRTPKDITNDLLAQHADLHTAINKKLVQASVEIRLIKSAIDELDEPARCIFHMRYLEGAQWEQIALTVNYTRQGAVKVHNKTVKDNGW